MIPELKHCVPIFFCLLGSLLFCACTTPTDNLPSLEDLRDEQRPDQESWFTRYDVLAGDRPRMQVYADYIANYDRQDSTYMILRGHPDSLSSRIVAHLYDEAGDSSATIVANEMIYFERDRRMESRGNVVVTTSDQKRLETEHLIWLELDQKVRTEGFVRITSPRENIQGYDLVADEDLENYAIARVTGKSLVDDL